MHYALRNFSFTITIAYCWMTPTKCHTQDISTLSNKLNKQRKKINMKQNECTYYKQNNSRFF